MEAKDTVMGIDRKDQIINLSTKLTDPMPLLQVMRFGDAIALEQAEISFKAGIREVADWVENNNHYSDRYDTISIENTEWQAKLKEWGISK